MKITLLAKSSSGGSYPVEFTSDSNSVRILCHCQAGLCHLVCKHKLAFLRGDKGMLFDPDQVSLLLEIHTWPQLTALRIHLDEYEGKLNEIETDRQKLLKREKTIKAEFAHALLHGVD
jgi:hypothetical protein